MAKQTVRQVSIFINGNEVVNSIKSIAAEQKKLTNELVNTVRGTEEYERKASELTRVNGILREHNDRIRGIKQGWDLTKVGLDKIVGVAAGAFAVDSLIGYGKQLYGVGVQMDALDKKAKTVFGATLPQVTAEAEKNARAMGLTTSQYINAAAAIQDILIPMGFQRKEAANISTELVNLSGALSEWTGGKVSATQVSDILSSALTGEREQLKQLGIVLQQSDIDARLAEKGLDKLTGTTRQQAEATATLELILEKSTDAQRGFAEGSDSAVRRQAELAARTQEVVEKLSTLLLPVFEALASAAGLLVGGIADVVEGIGDLVNPAKAASEAFDEQATKVEDLENNIVPLLDRYDQLAGQTVRSKKEQDELQKIITTVAGVIPTAIQGFDEYGRALGLNTEKAREFIEIERARLKFINQEAISATDKQITDAQKRLNVVLEQLRSGQTISTTGTGIGQRLERRSLEGSEIQQLQAEAQKLQETLQGANAEVARLRGETLKVQEIPVAGDGGGGGGGTKTDEKERARLEAEQIAVEQIKRGEKIQATLNDLIARESAKRQKTFQIEQEYMLDAYQATKEQEKLIDLDFEAEKSAAQEEIRLFLQSDKEAEIESLQNHYAVLLSLADQYGIDTASLRKKQEEEIAEINKKYADEEAQRQYETNQARLAALGSMFTEFGNLVSGTFDLLAGEGEKSAAFQKVATLAKIAFDTAAAISSLVAASEANPANALTFGAAGVAQYVSGLVRILSNIAQAKKILSGAPKVQQKAGGGFLSVTGSDDGRTYNASVIPTPYTGLLPNHPVLFQSNATGAPVLASERGAEYFVSSEALRNPYVANLTRMIDNIAGGRSVAQFAEGGVNPPATATTSPTVDISVIERNTAVMEALLAALGRGIVAVIPDRTLTDIPERLGKINNASGGFFG